MQSQSPAVEATTVNTNRNDAGSTHPSLTIVTCVEAGPLELMVLRMAESLRRWGGRFRDCPIIAYNPRFGPPLTRATRKAFDELGVTYRRIRPENRYAWMSFYNKPLAVVSAEEEATTDFLAFIDGDILFMGEPDELVLPENIDFAASATNKTVGSSGPGDVNEPYWEAVCSIVGLAPDDLPWVTTCHEKVPIRAYWQGGVFAFRRSMGYGRAYLDVCTELNDSHVISHASRSYFTEQVSISLAMVRAGLRWHTLSDSHNYNFPVLIGKQIDAEPLRDAKLYHYHEAFWPRSWPDVLRLFKAARPDVHDWLEAHGPLENPSAAPWRAVSKFLRHVRARRYAAFEASCRTV